MMKSIAIEIKLNGVPKVLRSVKDIEAILTSVREKGSSIKLDPAVIKRLEKAIDAINKKINEGANLPPPKSDGYVTLGKEVSQAKRELEKLIRSGKATSQELEEQRSKVAALGAEQRRLRTDTRTLIETKRAEAKTYDGTSAKLNLLRKRYKDLAVQNKQNTKEAKNLRKEITTLDRRLKTIDKDVGQFQRSVGNYTGAFKTFGKNILGAFGVVGGVSIISSIIADISKESVQLANDAKGVDFAFNQIAGSADILDRARASTQGLLSDLDIKKSITEFNNFGIELEQLPELLEFVSVRAAQTGKDFKGLRDSLVEGLSKESKLRIDNLGISTAELNAELKKTPNFVQAVANIAKREIAEAGDVISEADKAQQRYNATMENAKVLFGNFLNEGVKPAIGGMESLVKATSDLLFPQEAISKSLAEEQLSLNLLVNELDDANLAEERRSKLINKIKSDYPEFNALIDVEKANSEQLKIALSEVNEEYSQRIALQREIERGDSIQSDIDRQLVKAADARRKLFRELTKINIDADLGLDIDITNIDDSFNKIKKLADSADLNFFEDVSFAIDVELPKENLDRAIENARVLSDQYREQQEFIEEYKGSLNILTESERDHNAELARKVKLYNEVFGTNILAITEEQILALNKEIATRKKMAAQFEASADQRKKDAEEARKLLEKRGRGLQALRFDLSELNKELQNAEGENEIENKLIEIRNKEEDIERLQQKIDLLKKSLNAEDLNISLDVAGENQLTAGLTSADLAPQAGDPSVTVESDPITAERKLLEEIKALREKFGADDLLKKKELTDEEFELLNDFEETKQQLELQRAVDVAEAKLGIQYTNIEDRLAAEEEYFIALQDLQDNNNEIKKEQLEEGNKELAAFATHALTLSNAIFSAEKQNAKEASDEKVKTLEKEYKKKIQAARGNVSEQARLEEELEKRRTAIEKEGAEDQRQIALKQALINAALAVTKTLSTVPYPASIPLVAALAVTTAFQIGTISQQKFEDGGEVKGRSHAQGGELIEAEGGEFVVNKESYQANKGLIEEINSSPSKFPKAPPLQIQPYFKPTSSFEGIPAPIYNLVQTQSANQQRKSERIAQELAPVIAAEFETSFSKLKDEFIDTLKDSIDELADRVEKGTELGSFKGSSLGSDEGNRRVERERIEREQSEQ